MSNVFSRILVAVDGSEQAKAAALLGARLAREHDGDLIFCNSVNWLPLIAELESAGAVIDPQPTVDGLMRHGEVLLAQAAGAARQLGVAARCRVVEGEPAPSILQLATREQCGLIVMGTHGRSGLGRLFIGSTTEAVLRGSTIPVLTVRPGTKVSGDTQRCFERVVVGIDDSEPANAAIDAVIAMPATDRRQVLFCSIVDIDSVLGARGRYDAAIRDSLFAQARVVVERALATARAHEVAAAGRVVEGCTSRALIAAAAEARADLVVMGTHGRRGIRRVFQGSIAETMVRTAPLPVLVVRSARTAARSAARAEWLTAGVR